MLVRIIAFLLLVSFEVSASCLLTDALKDPKLSGNARFWEEYSDLSAKGNISDKDMQSLIAKHTKSSDVKSTNTTPVKSEKMVAHPLKLNSQAQKDVSRLTKNLREKMDEFMDLAVQKNGLQKIRENPGRWRLEKVIENHRTYQTVRLNDGYRVLFDIDPTGEVKIFGVNKSVTH